MLITPTNIRGLFTGFKAAFATALSQAPTQYLQIATVVPSATGTEDYAWLGQLPSMREWIGDRVVHALQAHGYSIKNKSFESTVQVPRTAIEDDTYGVFTPLMSELGTSAGAHPDQLVFNLLKSGETAKCYDGKAFFADNHPVTDEKGKTVSQSNADLSGNGPTWYVLDTSRALKPLIYQDRKKPNFVAMTAETDPNVFTKAQYEYGVDARGNAGFGFWQMAYASNLELNNANVWAAIQAMSSRTGEGGRPLGLRGTVLVVPGTLEAKATKLLTSDLINDDGVAVDNDLKGRLKPLISPWLL